MGPNAVPCSTKLPALQQPMRPLLKHPASKGEHPGAHGSGIPSEKSGIVGVVTPLAASLRFPSNAEVNLD